jgi:hypothetical protein
VKNGSQCDLFSATKEEVFAKLHVAAYRFDKEGLIVNKAIAIYPRYYAAGEGEPESAKQAMGLLHMEAGYF